MAFFTKQYHTPGTPPGTLANSDRTHDAEIKLRLVDYTPETLLVEEDVSAEFCTQYLSKESATWIHVQGSPDKTRLEALGTAFGLHQLALEDVFNTGQRPKAESFNKQLFVVINLPQMNGQTVEIKQVSIFVAKEFLISFCEGAYDPFTEIISRFEEGSGRLRQRGTDFLLYSLLDIVIDEGFPVLEAFGTRLEAIEEQILNAPSKQTLHDIHFIKRELILLRRTLWPQREVVNQLLRDDFAVITEKSTFYLRDCYDHSVQLIELTETYRDMAGGMLDIYVSHTGNQLNDVMRLLTLISTVFIPLTFLAGIYGMNFNPDAGPLSMPELNSPYGYVAIWSVMVVTAGGMLMLFKKKGWL